MPKPGHDSGQRGWGRHDGGRSKQEWCFRVALVLAALVLGYMSFVAALGNVVVKVDPGSAFALNPADGQIAAAFAQQKFTAAPATASDSEPSRIAAQALRMDSTAVEALTVLGLAAQLRSDNATADRAFGYSVWLSRRELQPQLWAIEKAVARGDINQALMHYDIAMRTSQKARDMLFPVLSAAVAESKIRSSLVPIIVRNPVWTEGFIEHAAVKSPEPQAVADLFRMATARGFSIGTYSKAYLVNNLATRGFIEDAWDYYITFRRDVERGSSRDPNFELDEKVRTLFDWNMGNAPGLSVAILREKDGGIVDFAVAPSTIATVVTQVQMLPPGNYRLSGRSRGIDQPERSRPYWSLTCHTGHEFGRVQLPNSSERVRSFAGEFTVPFDCPVQTLSLVLRASDNISGVSGQIESAQLLPIER